MYRRSVYQLGDDYPHEGFVQRALESHFERLGFQVRYGSDLDFVCVHPVTHEQWWIEAKGQTSQVGLDFRTGLGQLVQKMTDEKNNYGLAIPAIQEFVHQCEKVDPWVRKQLNLHWLVVSEDASVRVIAPDDSL
ncbi:hypothetical protein ANRL1_02270 [Anaerolineae bacterium]|nr:hypothetical protein ANRL1_02270 [Anaerolineae bacterium]